jgi:trehalose 6-phosphate phosphatase
MTNAANNAIMSTPPPSGPAGGWALFLDIDGTLLDLAPRPELVQVPASLPDRLATRARDLDGALALVSGRPLAAIDALIPGGLDAAGTHGAEWRQGGRIETLAPSDPAMLQVLARALRDQVQNHPGLLVEDKPGAIALHYRLAPDREAEARELAEQTARTLGPAYRLQSGKQVIEVLPTAAGKGAAIRRFMAQPPYAGRTPVFAGDDLTDEDGFAAVESMHGISIRVGPPGAPTRARHRLDSPAALRTWLAALRGPWGRKESMAANERK